MKKSLIRELDELENTHWWHLTKKNIFVDYIHDYIAKNKGQNTRILEIGAGAGNILAAFKDKAEVVALDPDKSAVEYCKKRGITKVIQRTFEEYKDFKPESIDIVIAADVLEHIKEDGEALKKIWSILKKGGVLLVHVPAHQSLFSYWDKALGHYRRYSKKQLHEALINQNFNVEQLFHRVILPYPFVKVFRKIKAQHMNKSNKLHSDFKNFPLFNGVLYVTTFVEDTLSKHKVISSPFGLSLFALARKK